MRRIDLRSRKKRTIYPKVAIAVLIVVILILSRATWNVFVKDRETRENLSETLEDLDSLKQREADLENEIDSLNTERGIDREIRDKFRVVKEDEGMIMLVDSPDIEAAIESDKPKSLWQKIKDAF